MSKKLTEEQIRDRFIEHVWALIEYWDKEPRAASQRDRLSGLVHSLLVALDGSAAALPGFCVSPSPHPDDRQYNIDEGEDYYPETEEHVDIAGSLHERLYRWAEENGVRKS